MLRLQFTLFVKCHKRQRPVSQTEKINWYKPKGGPSNSLQLITLCCDKMFACLKVDELIFELIFFLLLEGMLNLILIQNVPNKIINNQKPGEKSLY